MSKKRAIKEITQVATETVGTKKLKTNKATKSLLKTEEAKLSTPAVNSLRNLPLINLDENLKHRVILWFRNDLRIHDNAVLNWAINQKAKQIQFLPMFCFDPRFYDKSVPEYKMTRKTGMIRTRFQLETVKEFRQNLEALGSCLLVAHDKPENFVQKLIEPGVKHTVVYQAEICHEERQVEKAFKKEMDAKCIDYQFVPIWNSTLHHIDDLPYDPVEYFPHVYGNMRKKQVGVKVRQILSSPKKGDLPAFQSKDESVKSALSFIPDLKEDFKFTDEEIKVSET